MWGSWGLVLSSSISGCQYVLSLIRQVFVSRGPKYNVLGCRGCVGVVAAVTDFFSAPAALRVYLRGPTS